MVEQEHKLERLGFVTTDLEGAIKVIKYIWEGQSMVKLSNSSFTINSSGDSTEVITDSDTMERWVLPALVMSQLDYTLQNPSSEK
ncbi:hypothetical protein A2422_01840 [Candidatus Woesebacteria bacterium RIFOXYC1_FULL_31_51]|uniref:Uncharacterized protein n=1 Tax=Candidatus Woesebacteria bacterium GW2011_GWC2_31_9 TaxID=1618586 RepID=A0A0F9YK86_9BACT|nr:MAG: hypothetical protein UR17_C0001G0824 [Candidatus Woesebacteria bacterium GW2011_GWF1_31_35]KKP23631.1 MAG: hypothetical protein UR11_C0001G0605 [Candidatus Woesebacteria bacterium GW2011_GWC1_30_29]KKP26988.1 MAG: hypothetical protein UR13_C0001G0083 [Candidatus Woesebacteria bacterium GW2011_GWD1_31_12]KKP27906.1 MAG: hypothetical protein UR16_C0002G0236 [Candidatus Woesebacteria bacterium GW2011_GWB1_31_29]KKP31909.1 MAG: hypothetical protein UR21_C0004G0045 [Candidatus Woesebacteria 